MSQLWPINPLAGDTMSPDVDWLIRQLANIHSTDRPDEKSCKHAFGIYGRLLDLRVRGGGTFDLKGDIKKGFRIGPRRADRGLANELVRLERAARSGSQVRWIKAWAAVSPRSRDLVWRPTRPPVVKRKFKNGQLVEFRRAAPRHKMVGIDGVLVGPRAGDAIAAIVEARRNLATTPRDDRRGNRCNDAADALATAIRAAVFDLAGRVGFTRDPVEDTDSGPLVELGAAFDTQFGTRICWRLRTK